MSVTTLNKQIETETGAYIRAYKKIDAFVGSLFPATRINLNDHYLLNVHKCRLCKKPVVEYTEYEFMLEAGMCGRCDHVFGGF